MLKRTYYAWIIVLAFLALLTTSYLVYERYTPHPTGTLCTFGTSFDCLLVNNSYFSTVFTALYLDFIPYYIGFDLPFSVLGVLTYGLILILGVIGYFNLKLFQNIPKIIFYLTGITLAFSIYLTFIEAFVIKTWCIFCVAQAILVLLMFILTYNHKNKLTLAKH